MVQSHPKGLMLCITTYTGYDDMTDSLLVFLLSFVFKNMNVTVTFLMVVLKIRDMLLLYYKK